MQVDFTKLISDFYNWLSLMFNFIYDFKFNLQTTFNDLSDIKLFKI